MTAQKLDGKATAAAIKAELAERVTALRDKGVAITSGVRGWDMALRLQYDDVPVASTEVDLGRALDAFLADHAGEPKRIFCTYTAMLALRRMLGERYDLPEMGVDAPETQGA